MENLTFEHYRNEVLNHFTFLDLCELKESIDYVLALIDKDTDVKNMMTFLGFNANLSRQITAYVTKEMQKICD